MKTKEDLIKQAYGEYWEFVKDYVDENGRLTELWGSIFYEQKNKKLAKIIEHLVDNCGIEFIGEHYAIPKSLQGIENNNGWIKIESEEDLPKDEENLDYWVMEDKQIVHAKFMPDSKRWYCDIDLNLRLFPSHYQPMVKPKQPIY